MGIPCLEISYEVTTVAEIHLVIIPWASSYDTLHFYHFDDVENIFHDTTQRSLYEDLLVNFLSTVVFLLRY